MSANSKRRNDLAFPRLYIRMGKGALNLLPPRPSPETTKNGRICYLSESSIKHMETRLKFKCENWKTTELTERRDWRTAFAPSNFYAGIQGHRCSFLLFSPRLYRCYPFVDLQRRFMPLHHKSEMDRISFKFFACRLILCSNEDGHTVQQCKCSAASNTPCKYLLHNG